MRERKGDLVNGMLLLVDTCGVYGSVALVSGQELVGERLLPAQMASSVLLGAVRGVLFEAALSLGDLTGIGVVSGPGSFTGLRVGLAVAKGLCEAGGLALAAVSRLAVLADAGGVQEGFAVLMAGRDQLYVRGVGGGGGRAWERMIGVEAFGRATNGREVVYAEAEIEAMLTGVGAARRVAVAAKNAAGLVRACLRAGGSDVARTDANYVRDEGAIYQRADYEK